MEARKRKYLRRAPRNTLGVTLGALTGYAAGWLANSVGIGLFVAVAIGCLAAFGNIGIGEDAAIDSNDPDGQDR